MRSNLTILTAGSHDVLKWDTQGHLLYTKVGLPAIYDISVNSLITRRLLPRTPYVAEAGFRLTCMGGTCCKLRSFYYYTMPIVGHTTFRLTKSMILTYQQIIQHWIDSGARKSSNFGSANCSSSNCCEPMTSTPCSQPLLALLEGLRYLATGRWLV